MVTKQDKMCSYFDDRATPAGHAMAIRWARQIGIKYEDKHVPTKREKCPICGRVVKQRISFCHDGCCVIYSMPKHKKKGWYKRNKTESKKNTHLNKRDKSQY